MIDGTVSFPENWTPPRELTRALPRETRILGLGRLQAILGWGMLLGAAVFFLAVRTEGQHQAARIEMLRTQGRETDSRITSLWRRGKSSTPMVAYAFTVNGARISGDSEAPRSLWLRMRVADHLPVRFVPSNPAVNHPTEWAEVANPAWLPFLLPALFVPLGIFVLRSLKQQRRLVAEGMPAAGAITGCYRTKNGWLAHYQFRTKDGAVVRGRSQVYSKFAEGTAVCVLYLPEKPQKSQLYLTSAYKVVTQ